MFEYHNNILCVQGGWLYTEGDILTKSNYKALKRRCLNTVRRACNGNPALVEYESIPERFKKIIVERFGDPYKSVKHTHFKDYIEYDQKAFEYFSNYTLDNGLALPEINIKEYTANATILKAVDLITTDLIAKRKALGANMRSAAMWSKIDEIVQELPKHTYPHSLPKGRRLRQRLKELKKNGYQTLIHKNFCNKNSEKINDDAKYWLISRYADRVSRCTIPQLFREYNELAKEEEWKQLENQESIKAFLFREDIKNMWYGHRYGELNAKEKYTFKNKTKLPSMRDSLWYGDGTKMNYYYIDEKGNIATCQVYEVIDAFSEVLLGYHISQKENYDAQYHSYKMAVQNAGHKPYQIGFDGQGGHGKLKTGNFLTKITKLAIKTAPYNGQSKTIENAFKRFQETYLHQDWFFTGQNIQAKKQESKANMEMILANKENLPTLKEVKEVYAKRRKEWNSAPHPKTGVPRLQMYQESTNPDTPAISIWDMIEYFWIQRKDTSTYTPSGIKFSENKVDYEFVVYGNDRTEDGYKLPDMDFLTKNVDKKFVIKFDPTDMTLINLYDDTPLGLRFVTSAETKIETHRGRQEQEAWEAKYYEAIRLQNEKSRVSTRDNTNALQKRFGLSVEDYGLNEPRIKGVESSKAQKAKAKKKAEKEAQKEYESIGAYQKEVSNMDALDETMENVFRY